MLEYIFLAVAFVGFMLIGYGVLHTTKPITSDN